MEFKFWYIVLLAIVATTLTGCPEGALSEGFSDEICEHDYSFTHWQYANADSVVQLHLVACNIWELKCGDKNLAGYYTVVRDTITGGVTDGKDSITIVGLTKGNYFSGAITDGGKTMNLNNFVFKRQ